MKAAVVELGPYFVLVLVGFLPNEVWRLVGLVTARGLSEDSELVVWSRTVATALLAGVIAKLILFSSGELAGIPSRCASARRLARSSPLSQRSVLCSPGWRRARRRC